MSPAIRFFLERLEHAHTEGNLASGAFQATLMPSLTKSNEFFRREQLLFTTVASEGLVQVLAISEQQRKQ